MRGDRQLFWMPGDSIVKPMILKVMLKIISYNDFATMRKQLHSCENQRLSTDASQFADCFETRRFQPIQQFLP